MKTKDYILFGTLTLAGLFIAKLIASNRKALFADKIIILLKRTSNRLFVLLFFSFL
jgi:hypothetical protein